jgi:hypothetical protein
VEEVSAKGMGAEFRDGSARLAVALLHRRVAGVPHEYLGVIVGGDQRPGVVGYVH